MHLPRAGVERGQQQLADPAGRGLLGPLPAGQVQAARLGALDVRRVADHQQRRRRRLAERARDRDRERRRRRAPRAARRRTRGRRRPSARGRARRPGRAAASPSAIAWAASTAVRVPANLSGATRMRTASSCRAARRFHRPAGETGACQAKLHPSSPRFARQAMAGVLRQSVRLSTSSVAPARAQAVRTWLPRCQGRSTPSTPPRRPGRRRRRPPGRCCAGCGTAR